MTAKEKKLWHDYKSSKSIETRNKLAEHYMTLVKNIALYQYNKTPAQVQYEELVSAGYLGLLKTIESYDPSIAGFKTYARKRILGAMIDWMRKLDPVPRLSRSRKKKLETARNAFIVDHQHNPGDDELREFMGVSKQEFRKIITDSDVHNTIGLYTTNNDEYEYEASALKYDDIDRARIDDRDDIEFVLKCCDPENSIIIILYYYKGLTMRQISSIIGMSESRISQLHKKLLRRLRSKLTSA